MTLGDRENFWQLMFRISTIDYFVYVIELDGKVIYVGQTKDIMGRLRHYKCTFLKGKCHNPKLQELFDAGDIQRSIFRIVAMSASRKESIKIESHFIEKYRETCLNKYDTFVSKETRKKLSLSSKKMWSNDTIRKRIVNGISKKHILTSPEGIVYEFSNSYEVKDFLDKRNKGLHQNDRKRVGYQMLESCGENKGWKMEIEGKSVPHRNLCGLLRTPQGEEFQINGKWDLVNINRVRKFRLNVNRLIKKQEWNGFWFMKIS